MTMRTRTNLACECGHTGYHVHSENDQPYGECWDRYDLKGFQGGGPEQRDVTKMTCDKCGKIGRVKRA